VLDITKAMRSEQRRGCSPGCNPPRRGRCVRGACERDPERPGSNVEPRVSPSVHKSDALACRLFGEYVFRWDCGAYAEKDARRPLNEYGRQKVALEDIVLATGRGMVCRTSECSAMTLNARALSASWWIA